MKKPKKQGMDSYLNGTGAKGVMALAQQVPGIADSIIDLLENNPNAYSSQPIVNASTMRGMVSPYAFGGEVDDEQMTQLQAMADEQGITVEELIQILEQEKETEQVPEDLSEFAYGGVARKTIEVEGGEVLETPGGQVMKVKGKKHEEGGVDLTVKGGTKIFSNRLKVDDKTMQERKLSRERTQKRIERLLAKNPTDQLLKSSLQRTLEVNESEEAKDMAIQETVNAIANGGEFAFGGTVASKKKYAFGSDGEDPVFDKRGFRYPGLLNYLEGLILPPDSDLPITANPINTGDRTGLGIGKGTPGIAPNKIQPEVEPVKEAGRLGVGDYIGLAGNAFNAIAPIVNTRRNKKGNRPNINRYLGFGEDALNTNQQAQGYVAGVKSNAMTNANTAANTAYARNRNSAQGVNTVRALDIATDMVKDKSTDAINDSFTKSMMSLLDQRGQLENVQDQMEMRGEAMRDTEDKADRDNYFTNMAENLVNFGTNVQGIGRALNTARSNKTDAKLISQLSKYGLGFDDDGKLITINK